MNEKHFPSLKLILQITDLKHIIWDSIDRDSQSTSTDIFVVMYCR